VGRCRYLQPKAICDLSRLLNPIFTLTHASVVRGARLRQVHALIINEVGEVRCLRTKASQSSLGAHGLLLFGLDAL
jgi:hypothetical protein